MRYDYCVVGQGLAGSALALHLLEKKKTFIVYDLPQKNISSSVAAGIYNPITGKNWVKTWMADKLFPYCHNFYQKAEELTGIKFLEDRLIYRPFSELKQQNDWMGRTQDPLFSQYIHDVHTQPIDSDFVQNQYGGLEIKQGGRLNIPDFLSAVRQLLMREGCFKKEYFDIQEVTFHDDYCTNGDLEFEKVILCQGTYAINQKIWKFLPFRPVKGEILSVRVEQVITKIYNKGAFVLPQTDGYCRVGSTYDHHDLSTDPTQKGRDRLLEKLGGFFTLPFRILDQIAGIRPATYDRKPFIGMHPSLKNVFIFNGLGAKGVTLAPYFANHLLEHIEKGSYLMQEVEIKRIIQ